MFEQGLLDSTCHANSTESNTERCCIYTCNSCDKLTGRIFSSTFDNLFTLLCDLSIIERIHKIDNIINFYHAQISTNAPQNRHVMPMPHVTTQKDLTFVNATLDSVVMVLHVKVGFCLLIHEVFTKSCRQS